MHDIEDIIRKAIRRHGEDGLDFAQEARLAAWRASSESDNVGYIRMRAAGAVIDAFRRLHGRRHRPEFETFDESVHGASPDWQPAERTSVAPDDLRILTQVARHSASNVADSLKLSRPTFSKRMARIRARVQAAVDAE